MRRVLLIVGGVLFLAAGTVVIWIDYRGSSPHVGGVSVERVARYVWFLGFVCLVIDDVRRIVLRRRSRRI